MKGNKDRSMTDLNHRVDINIKKRNDSLDGIQIGLLEYKQKVLNCLKIYGSAQVTIKTHVLSVFDSIKQKFEMIDNEINTEISRIDKLMIDQTEEPELYISKHKSRGLGAILRNYEDFNLIDLDSVVADLYRRLNSEIQHSNSDSFEMKKQIDSLNTSLQSKAKVYEDHLQTCLMNNRRVKEELQTLISQYELFKADFIKKEASYLIDIQTLTQQKEKQDQLKN